MIWYKDLDVGESIVHKTCLLYTSSFLALFICLMGYFSYFQFFKSEEFINNPYNKMCIRDRYNCNFHSLHVPEYTLKLSGS